MNPTRQVIPLDKAWQYRSLDKTDSFSEWQPSQPLPTTIHLDLLAAGRIPDPFRGKNEELVQWVGERTWEYERVFTIPNDWTRDASQRVVLVCEGLDTIATIHLNGKVIHEANNMFLSHRVDITKHIAESAPQSPHSLRILFHAFEPRGAEEVSKHPEHNWVTFASGVTRLAVRKTQYHFGWDWGPRLMDAGPWKPIYLETYRSRIIDTAVQVSLVHDHGRANLDAFVDIEGEGATHVGISIEIDGAAVATQLVDVKDMKCSAQFQIQNPQIWWPFTLGEQPLYKAVVVLMTQSNGTTAILDKTETTFGIRRIELVQRPVHGEEGSTFCFQANGVPIFVGGSCWIPADSFLPRITPQKYRELVTLARESNQVMIRVWGGGIYEHDSFYEACDELGILVWQDFMFACGIFPAHDEFQEIVKTEITQNIKRLRHHPCMALWCGNNEDYIIPLFSGSEYDPEENNVDKIVQSKFPARVFYEHIFPEYCRSLSPDIPYWPGSPFGGAMVNSDIEGDVHQWHVWHLERFPYQQYSELSARFISEFGMQAAPTLATSLEFFPLDVTPPTGDRLTSDEHMEWHNKCGDGAENLEQYCTSNITFRQDTLQGYVYGTQLIQAEAVATAYRSWRRLWKGPGREHCAGALVWQLNDCWPVTSWAVVDSNLHRKMAFWAIKRENAAITAGLARRIEDGSVQLEAWACNMTLRGVSVTVEVRAWDSVTGKSVCRTTLWTGHRLQPNQATELGVVDLRQYGVTAAPSKQTVVAIYLWPTVGSTGSVSSPIARHVNFHEPLKEMDLTCDANHLSINVSYDTLDSHSAAKVVLDVTVPMKGVFLEFPDQPQVVLDDNCVDLVPGESCTIRVTALPRATRRVMATWLSEKGWQSTLKSIAPHGGYKV